PRPGPGTYGADTRVDPLSDRCQRGWRHCGSNDTPVTFATLMALEPMPIISVPFCMKMLSATPETGLLLASVPETTLPRKLAPEAICSFLAKSSRVLFSSTLDCRACICESCWSSSVLLTGCVGSWFFSSVMSIVRKSCDVRAAKPDAPLDCVELLDETLEF